MIVEVSIRAFIPRYAPGALVTIKKGPYAGQTAVELPLPALVFSPRRWGDPKVAYVGDNREFSLDRKASARMVSRFKLDVSRGELTEPPTHGSMETVEVELETGRVRQRDYSSTERRKWEPLRETRASRPEHRIWTIDIEAKGSDPLVWTAHFAPIEMNGRFTIERASGKGGRGRIVVSFEGKTSYFPAFESVARVNGIPRFVFKKPVEPGRTALDLQPLKGLADTRGRVVFDAELETSARQRSTATRP